MIDIDDIIKLSESMKSNSGNMLNDIIRDKSDKFLDFMAKTLMYDKLYNSNMFKVILSTLIASLILSKDMDIDIALKSLDELFEETKKHIVIIDKDLQNIGEKK